MNDHSDPLPRVNIPPPSSISEQARQILAAPALVAPDYPETAYPAAWNKHVAELNAMFAGFYAGLDQAEGFTAHQEQIAGVPVYGAAPQGADPARVLFDIHGGAFFYMGGCGFRRSRPCIPT